VLLDLAARLARVVFELARRGIEGVPQRHIGIFVRLVLRARAADVNLASRNPQLDADGVALALVVMPVWRLDHHLATDDAVEIALELFRLLPRLGLK
jgi:hypothetical protein